MANARLQLPLLIAALFLCDTLFALPCLPLPSRLASSYEQLLAAVDIPTDRCGCGVDERWSRLPDFYPDCLSSASLGKPERQACVPRVIHQTWKERLAPNKYMLYHRSWMHQNPGWLVLLWTDSDVLEWMTSHYAWFLPTFTAYKHPVQRADAFRYFVLHAYGGVYADLDYEAVKPLDYYVANLSRPLAFVGPGDWASSISNSLMISQRCPNLWQPLLDGLAKADVSSRSGLWGFFPSSQVMSSTGPTYLRMWLESEHPDYVCRLKRAQFSPCDYCNNCNAICDAYAVHHYARSWNDLDTLLLNLIVCNWQFMIVFFLFCAILRTHQGARVLVLAVGKSYCAFLKPEILLILFALALTITIAVLMPLP